MSKEVTMTFRVEPELRDSFAEAAERQHRPASQVLRDLMRGYVDQVDALPAPPISEAERQRRLEAVNYARASVGLEGFKMSAAAERHAQRFIAGEINLQDYVKGAGESTAER